MRALVVGASGFVGGAILSRLGPERAVGTRYNNSARHGLARFDAARNGFADLTRVMRGDFSHVILAHGAINPELCAECPVETGKINVESMIRLLQEILDARITPIFLSTDYVFDGTRGLWEDDAAQCPNTEYGRQKAAVEQWLQARSRPWLVVRLSKVVSGERNTHSVLGQWVDDVFAGKSMQSATDQIFSPLHVHDVAESIINLAESGRTGIYNVAGPEALSRYELNNLLVASIKALVPQVNVVVKPCSLRDIRFREHRPLNTSLSIKKAAAAINTKLRPMAQVCSEIAEEHFGTPNYCAGRQLGGGRG
ncbi:sugar nucleotide-binding protein [Bradyrhizobium sp. ORS 375]|uniref:SDR family oxidoreductase n=1 Tax=Bradyrhizobium sp. (strain ORS 375) TaxID=566679 RepID=UPI0015857420|nr:sugar nucleotide-binding protein [Bradyrhizobium sp. ORS 375]